MSWPVHGLEKNFQTWGRMRGEQSLLEWETLLELQAGSRESQHWTGVFSSSLFPVYKVQVRDLAGHLLTGWGTYTGWGKSRANTFSLWGRRGRQGMLLRRIWNSLIVTTWVRGWRGRTIGDWFFPFLPSKALLVCLFACFPLFFCPWAATTVNNSLASAGDRRDTGSIHESRRSSGGGHSNPLQ